MWTPISLKKLENLILSGELELEDELLNFWNLIKIEPRKWQEQEYGDEGGGFWVVAIFGNEVIYYNDIEEGFNISKYETYGQIKEYWCNQSELNWIIIGLYERMKSKI
ncbi:hypothetical protein HDE69_001950 [Pedobacter cryoconitis]|uniref:Uncharacterized protein n=1 Tax=Pedobacter cryoconitis TaxID=188932 RepID=A0A7W8YSK8_9SPHI|nr:hypothetical protein [Pedobacter cryoconitis]MBB5620897.1 hypothetical protein [Pedobacter cryoconitis]